MPVTISAIHRYPVKGLSAEALTHVHLRPGEGVPHDRRFAFALPWTSFDPDQPQWLPKTSYLMLMRNESLARLRTRFDPERETLTIDRDGVCEAFAKVTEPAGRAVLEGFFAEFIDMDLRGGRPRLVEAPPRFMFSDHANCVVSILNLASLRELEQAAGAPVDPIRFRANIHIDGLEPWAEFSWVGHEIAMGGVRLEVTSPIDRCAATTVNPTTAVRDLQIPRILQTSFGHVNFGIYARVVAAGAVAPGAVVVPPTHPMG